jgi:CheY-like chemotaxis protein
MSHELRTPLNAVLGFAQLMGRSETLAPGERESLSIIRRSGQHLLGLINDVLSISRIEAGKLAVDRRPLDPRRMIDDIGSIIRERAEAAGLRLVVDADSSLPPAVMGDEGKLRQIFIKLLSNAVKFTKHGTVTLRARWANDHAMFEVADTGPGIDPVEHASLFEPFVQTEAGRDAKEGTGLGLAITRQLVRLMGGEIHVFSQVGSGTIFRFDVELPRTDLPVPRRESHRVLGLAPGEARRRILVVDDARENCLLLSRLLATVGFEVREAANGSEALDLWRQWRPDLIFMDERMPRMDGSEATRIIRAEEAEQRKKRTAIVALTASAFEHEREVILASGADDFVVKPHSEEDIFDAIGRMLGVAFRKRDISASGSNRVLLVDDDMVNLHIARELLSQLGFDVSVAQDGREALAMLDASAFDVVLLDIEMPGLDGRATVKEIRARKRYRDLPVIAMSAHDGDVIVEGMTDYLGKPIDATRLAAVLARILPRFEQRPV